MCFPYEFHGFGKFAQNFPSVLDSHLSFGLWEEWQYQLWLCVGHGGPCGRGDTWWEWMALTGALGRSEEMAVASVDFYIFRMSICTERDFITFPSPSLWITHGKDLSLGEERWCRRILGQSLYLQPTPRWISAWEYSTMQPYLFGFIPITNIHAMKNNIFIVDCFNYVKCIVSIICGGNRTQVRIS